MRRTTPGQGTTVARTGRTPGRCLATCTQLSASSWQANTTLPRIVADWGDHLYGNEPAALDQVAAALDGLGTPSGAGRVTVPPGTVRPLPGQDLP